MRLLHYALLSLLPLSASCTLGMNYAQCSVDADCPPNGNSPQFCTSDQICVIDTPAERLCTQTEPANPAPNALHLGALFYAPPNAMTPGMIVRRHAIELGVSEINDLAKTDQARPIAVHICDISGSSGDALNSLQVLISKYNVAAVIGPDSQQALSDVIGLASSSAVPIISPAGTATALVQLPSLGYLLRMAPVETQQASSLAREVPNGAILGVISTEEAYGNNVRRSFLSAWTNRDTKNNMVKYAYSYTESINGDLSTAATQLLGNMPSYAVTIAATTQAPLLELLQGLPDIPGDTVHTDQIITSDSAHTDEVLALAVRPDMVESFKRVRGIGPLSLTTAIEGIEFKTAYQSRFPTDRLSADLFAAYTYDALYVLAVAMNSIKGDVNGASVLAVLRMMTNSMNVLSLSRVTFPDTVRAISQGNTFTLTGASGAIRFTPEGSRDPSLFERFTIDTSNFNKPDFVSTPL